MSNNITISIPKISIIIPVYNAGEFMASCIESILAQTFKDFELLLVDDGSTDDSGKVCDEYAAKDSRVRVIHKENGGCMSALMRGLNEARADWVEINDDDDTFEPYALESLYALHEGTDLVIGFFEVPDYRLPADASLEDCRHAFLTGKLPFPMWAKLYRRDLIKDVLASFCEDDKKTSLDMNVNTQVFFKITRPPHVLYKHIYNYRRNTASISHAMKASLEYEESFYNTIYDSIPTDELPKYMYELTSYKLNGLFKIAYSHPETLVNKQHPYLLQLHKDIKACNYHMSLKERLVLNSTSKFILKLTGFFELASHSLKYRLGLLIGHK